MKFIVFIVLIFLSCFKNVNKKEFDSTKWHYFNIISDNNVEYLKNAYSDTYLEFLENKKGFIDFGFKKIDFNWSLKGDYLLINDTIYLSVVDGKINLPLNKISNYPKENVILSVKEGLAASNLNENKSFFINTNWTWTKLYDSINGYYSNLFFNIAKEKFNIENINLSFYLNSAVFDVQKIELSMGYGHIFGKKDTFINFWREKGNVLNIIENTMSDDYFFITPIHTNNELRIPMKDPDGNTYYLILEQKNKLYAK